MGILTLCKVMLENETTIRQLFKLIFLDHLSDEQIWSRFCDTFRFAIRYPEVSYSEFLNVYEGLSLSVDQDDDFVHLVNNTWNI